MVGGLLTREEIQDILTIANEVAEHTRAGNVAFMASNFSSYVQFFSWGRRREGVNKH